MKVEMIRRDLLTPDKDQPRKYFDEEKLDLLKSNIELNGILNPLIVKEDSGKFIIVDGERRFKASESLKDLPCIIIDCDNMLELQLVTSCLKEDLTVDELDKAIYKLYRHCETSFADDIDNSYDRTKSGSKIDQYVGKKIGKSPERVSKAIDRFTFKQDNKDFTETITRKYNPENKDFSKVNSTISMTESIKDDDVRKVVIEDILEKKHSKNDLLPKFDNPIIKEKIKEVNLKTANIDNVDQKKTIAKDILNNVNLKHGIEKDINECFLNDLSNLRMAFLSFEKKGYSDNTKSIKFDLLEDYKSLAVDILSYLFNVNEVESRSGEISYHIEYPDYYELYEDDEDLIGE